MTTAAELVGQLNAGEVRELTDVLIQKEREQTRSLAIQVASLLGSQLRFLGRPEDAAGVEAIGKSLLS